MSMKRSVAGIAAFAVLVAVGVVASVGQAADAPAPASEPYPVELRVGEIFKVCKSGQVICPAVRHICDDLKVVAFVDTEDGLGIKAVGPGTTLCSVSGSTGPGRVFRITVR